MADGSYQLIEVKGDNKIDDAIVKQKPQPHTITNERLAHWGYYDISEAYKSLH